MKEKTQNNEEKKELKSSKGSGKGINRQQAVNARLSDAILRKKSK